MTSSSISNKSVLDVRYSSSGFQWIPVAQVVASKLSFPCNRQPHNGLDMRTWTNWRALEAWALGHLKDFEGTSIYSLCYTAIQYCTIWCTSHDAMIIRHDPWWPWKAEWREWIKWHDIAVTWLILSNAHWPIFISGIPSTNLQHVGDVGLPSSSFRKLRAPNPPTGLPKAQVVAWSAWTRWMYMNWPPPRMEKFSASNHERFVPCDKGDKFDIVWWVLHPGRARSLISLARRHKKLLNIAQFSILHLVPCSTKAVRWLAD